jgi:putative tryptophan/tyrosine transport system substrate-binding protein
MRRREFLGFVGGAALACPVVARAQQPSVPVVGVLSVASLAGQEADTAAFLKGLGGTGYVEGHNVAIEFRWANNQLDRLTELAADLVSRRVAVIFATGGAASARAVKAATTSIPVVFANGQDPVALGLVESINRPSGNLTGVTFMASELGPKRLGLLNELVPGAARYGVLVDPDAPQTDSIVAELRTAAASIGRQIEVFGASTNSEIDTAFAELVRKGTDALVVGSSVLFNIRRVQVVTLAAIHRLPTIYYDRNSVEVGGLMSYGASIADAMRQGGVYVGRVLKGERPGALPVIQAGKFEFVINLQTAKSLRIAVPASMLARADEVIE